MKIIIFNKTWYKYKWKIDYGMKPLNYTSIIKPFYIVINY